MFAGISLGMLMLLMFETKRASKMDSNLEIVSSFKLIQLVSSYSSMTDRLEKQPSSRNVSHKLVRQISSWKYFALAGSNLEQKTTNMYMRYGG